MKLSHASIAGIVITGLVLAIAGLGLARLTRRDASTENAYVRADVTPIAAKIAGYIVQVGVRDNQPVKAGDLLFRIDDADFQARVDQARAAVEARRAAIGNLDRRLSLQRATVKQAEAALRGALAASARTTRDLGRTAQLTTAGWVSQARNDQVLADSQQAGAKVEEAQANLAAATRQIEVIESQRPQLVADVHAAEAALRLAQIDLDSTTVRAPVDGWVGERQARPGQYVRPGSLLIAVVSREVWVVANFKETQLARMAAGTRVSVMADGAPGMSFRGAVESLSPASGAQFALLPPDNATGNFTKIVQRIPVRITLAPGQAGLTRLRPGMSATVHVDGVGRRPADIRSSVSRGCEHNAGPEAARLASRPIDAPVPC